MWLMARLRVWLVVGVVALLAPTVALGHRRAPRWERRSIIAAVVDQGELSRAQADCQRVTVSTVSPSFATLTWPRKLSRRCASVAADGVIVERRGHWGWQLIAVGSSLPCHIPRVPPKVSRDLGLCR